MIAGIAVTTRKAEIFKKALDKANYSYTEHPGLVKDTVLLKVTFLDISKLKSVIEKAEIEASKPVVH